MVYPLQTEASNGGVVLADGYVVYFLRRLQMVVPCLQRNFCVVPVDEPSPWFTVLAADILWRFQMGVPQSTP